MPPLKPWQRWAIVGLFALFLASLVFGPLAFRDGSFVGYGLFWARNNWGGDKVDWPRLLLEWIGLAAVSCAVIFLPGWLKPRP